MPRHPGGAGAAVTQAAPPPARVPIDRIGWALATGSGACAVGAALVALASGAGAGTILLGALVVGGLAAMLIVLFAAPVWWLVGRAGRRGPAAAGATGAVVAALASAVVLTKAGGVLSGIAAMTVIAAFLGALIGLAMWLVAYPPR